MTEEVTETYRRAEQRLRLLLLGDGVSEPGVVKGEEARTRVTTALRQMRESLAEALGAETRASELQDELLRLAAGHTDASAETETLLTPAEVARELDVSVGRVYRAVKRNKIAALRTGKSDRSALRIPASEVGRLRESRG